MPVLENASKAKAKQTFVLYIVATKGSLTLDRRFVFHGTFPDSHPCRHHQSIFCDIVMVFLVSDELDLRNNDLTGTIPTEIGKMLRLRSLVLTGNRFTGSVPIELFSGPLLRDVSIHDNHLSGSIPDVVCNRDQTTSILVDCKKRFREFWVECTCCVCV